MFLAASGLAVLAFALTWLLREVPLRETAAAEGIGESFASPREERSDRELERIISSIVRGDARGPDLPRIVERSGVELSPAEAWLLGRLSSADEPDAAPARIARLTTRLVALGYLSPDSAAGGLELSDKGREAHARLVESGRSELTRLVSEQLGEEDELAPVLRRAAASLVSEMPRE